jgi:hypothetical protein
VKVMTWQMMTCQVSVAKSEAKVLWSLWVVVLVKRGNEMNKRLLKVPFELLFIFSFLLFEYGLEVHSNTCFQFGAM